jgi:hypothetical protein
LAPYEQVLLPTLQIDDPTNAHLQQQLRVSDKNGNFAFLKSWTDEPHSLTLAATPMATSCDASCILFQS